MEDLNKKLRDILKEMAEGGASASTVSHCSVHTGRKIELYCETCEELICPNCAFKGGKHHSHDCVLLKEALEKHREDIKSSMATFDEALSQFDTCEETISDQQSAIEAKIHESFKHFHEMLKQREAELISNLNQITQGKLDDLDTQRDQMQTAEAELSGGIEFVKESLRTGSHVDNLVLKTTLFEPDMLKPRAEADVTFVPSDELKVLCQNYGKLSESGSLDPASYLPDLSKCHITIKGVKVAENSTAGFKGECAEPEVAVERRREDQSEIGNQPTIIARHQLQIEGNSQGTSNSPVRVAPVSKHATPILTISGVDLPCGIAVGKRGEVVVAEQNGHCVSIFSCVGEKLHSFGTRGSGSGQFESPVGVAVDGDGNILVADKGNHRIQKITAEGQFLAAVGSGPLQFSSPHDLAFNASNSKVYVMDGNCRVQVLNSDLSFSSTFGKEGSGDGEFSTPCGIACDSTGRVYVADSCNHRIQVFTADGQHLRTFGRRGEGRGELNRPCGVAIDADGVLYVTECGDHRVSLFTSECQFLTSFCKAGERLESPRGLAVDQSGVVYVCDDYNNHIQVF